ncbi:hypothetical protein OSJ57_21375 [Sphingomonas sp. HH69]
MNVPNSIDCLARRRHRCARQAWSLFALAVATPQGVKNIDRKHQITWKSLSAQWLDYSSKSNVPIINLKHFNVMIVAAVENQESEKSDGPKSALQTSPRVMN